MSKYTKEMVDKYAEKLLIGLTPEENKMVLDEFEVIEKNCEIVNSIPNIQQEVNAPIEDKSSQTCGYCGATLVGAGTKWVLAKKEIIRQ